VIELSTFAISCGCWVLRAVFAQALLRPILRRWLARLVLTTLHIWLANKSLSEDYRSANPGRIPTTWHMPKALIFGQFRMGHTDIESTMRYLKPNRNKAVREKVNETFAGAYLNPSAQRREPPTGALNRPPGGLWRPSQWTTNRSYRVGRCF
jgi:hypothetical protein